MPLQSFGQVRLRFPIVLLAVGLIGLALLAAPPAAHAQTPGYLQVSAGLYHTCAIQGLYGDVGPVECWGDNYYGETTPPAGDFKQVTAGGYHTCGLKPDGSVQCWGSDEVLFECYEWGCTYVHGGQASPPATHFKQISAGLYHTCGVTLDGNVDCWGYNPHGETADRAGGNWLEVSAGEGHTCALRSDGVADCWGDNDNGRATDRTGPFTHLSAGGSHNCAIRQTDGKVECWGGNAYGQSTPPDADLRADQRRQPSHVRDTRRQRLAELDRVLGLQFLRPGQTGAGGAVQADRFGPGPHVRHHFHQLGVLLGAEHLRAGGRAHPRRTRPALRLGRVLSACKDCPCDKPGEGGQQRAAQIRPGRRPGSGRPGRGLPHFRAVRLRQP